MLPHQDLSVYYKSVTWLYVCRSFKQDAKDLEAWRSHDRIGVSSWPQMFLLDPQSLRKLGTPPRDLAGFKASFGRVLTAWAVATAPEPAARAARQAQSARDLALCSELDAALHAGRKPGRALLDTALGLLEAADRDPCLRQRGFELLARFAPGRLRGRARELLLALPLDPWRYAVLRHMAARPEPGDEQAILQLMAEVGTQHPSLNPNVVRIRAVKALETCGGAVALEGLLPRLAKVELRSALSRLLPKAIAAIAARLDDRARAKSRRALIAALPPAAPSGSSRQARFHARLSLAQVRALLAALAQLGQRIEPPKRWDQAVRKAVLALLSD